MSTLKVDGIRSNSASSDAITLASDGTCTANITNRSNKNLIVNGACLVAQRGTSATTATGGYHTVDRIRTGMGGHDEVPTFAQADVASGTTPYQKGFRKCFKVTNGNQTSGAGSSDYIQIDYYVEAQDIANSGWDVTNSSSNLTFSFWIKSSVSQFFTFAIRCKDGTEQVINFKTPVLSADTWTKVTKTIPGNSNLTVNNDTGTGFQIMFFPFIGTTYSTVGLAEDTWSSWASAKHAIPNTSTWWTTNDATYEITGLQLEVGSVATDFEHRSYGQELALCQRYYQRIATGTGRALSENATQYNGSTVFLSIPLPTTMRAAPSLSVSNDTGHFVKYANNGPVAFSTLGRDGVTTVDTLCVNATASGTAGHACMIRTDDASAYLAADSEL